MPGGWLGGWALVKLNDALSEPLVMYYVYYF